ncbi:hypothetical protein [Fluviispira sanaruensis]|uniref:Uncharacterized protein n=1 Tax=Fluviispira sanaruensis TaxID=2493639 RepID=A0A4P2VP41_FLUSA|nr:hypothetical protein [Fluviispira sanaruensis]BBH54738.1 hypothetical protein JCM31447_32120 [Fluviispira sanaruensis]
MKVSYLILTSLLTFSASASNPSSKLVWSAQIIDLETKLQTKIDIDTNAGNFDKHIKKYGFNCSYSTPINQNEGNTKAMKRTIHCKKEGETDKYLYSSVSICAAVNGFVPAISAANIIISDEKEKSGFSVSMACHLE